MNVRDFFMGAVLSLGVTFLGYMAHSVSELNKNVVVIIERQNWHDKAIKQNTLDIRDMKTHVMKGL